MLLNLAGFLSAAEFFARKRRLRSFTFRFPLLGIRCGPAPNAAEKCLEDSTISSRKSRNEVLAEPRDRHQAVIFI